VHAVVCLMKVKINIVITSYRYYKLDVTKNLRKNLSYKTVMEYPVLHVCIADLTPTEYVIYDPAVDTGEVLCT